MKPATAQQLQQIHAVLGPASHGLAEGTAAATYRQEHDMHEYCLLNLCPARTWHKGSYTHGCPRPILITKHHQHQIEELHEALTLAITDVVQRWWTDDTARFPQRMPLPKEEEGLLQWMEEQIPHGLPEFRDVLGSWRPDFLVGEGTGGGLYPSAETFCLTEINARFCFNGFMHEAYGQQALLHLGVEGRGLYGATDPAKIVGGLYSLFRLDRPLHLLKGEERGIDIHMFVDFYRRHLGLEPRIIAPQDLRLVPDGKAPLGYKLCCLIQTPKHPHGSLGQTSLLSIGGEMVEEIYQVGLELHQHELLALPRETLRAISLRCFNDLRTIFLVHDKRMLGIVREELNSLVDRSVLTEAQSAILRHGIAETFLPGSVEVKELARRCAELPGLRNDFLLKPIRGGKGAGIIFGDEVSNSEWISHLEKLESAEVVSGRGSWVIQRQVKQRLYEVVLGTSGERVQYPLVGTYHVAHGKLLGLGTWRSSPGRICAVSNGGSWICSVQAQS